jgi:hypothetical protein
MLKSFLIEKISQDKTIKTPNLKGLVALLRAVENDGKHCADEALLAGVAFGSGVIQLTQNLGQTNELGMQILVNSSLTLVGPIAISFIIVARLTPAWINQKYLSAEENIVKIIVPAGLVGSLLNLYLFWAAVLGGVLMSTRRDFVGEFRDVLDYLQPISLAHSCLETSIYTSMAATWALVETAKGRKAGKDKELVTSSILVHTFAIIMLLKILIQFISQHGLRI